jgi:hypothetical protein
MQIFYFLTVEEEERVVIVVLVLSSDNIDLFQVLEFFLRYQKTQVVAEVLSNILPLKFVTDKKK